MNIRPLNDRVVVRRNAEEETSAGGIILTGSAKEKPNEGEVIAVGPGKTLDNGSVKAPALSVGCLLYTSPSPRDKRQSRMPSSA